MSNILKSQTLTKRLIHKSAKAKGILLSTRTELLSVNKQIEDAEADLQTQIEALSDFSKTLSKERSGNEKVVTNISKIIGD